MSASKGQITIIHVLKSRMHLLDEHYRDMLASYNVTSSKDLSWAQAKELISILTQKADKKGVIQYPSKGQKRFDEYGLRPGMATPKQLRKIEALWTGVSRMPTAAQKREALNHFLSNHFGIDRIQWVPQEMVGKILITITSMQGATHATHTGS